MVRGIGVLACVVLCGCLGSPAERTCADYPRDTPECADYWASGDGAVADGAVADAAVGGDAAPDAAVDAGDGAVAVDGGEPGDGGAECAPGAVEPCPADGFCAGRRVCRDDRRWSACVPGDPVDEVCNGADDDCDGEVDELAERGCGVAVGACSMGVEACVEGAWRCEGAGEPGEEVCDGATDEDCDGSVDEGCPCQADAVEACGGSDVGACALGERRCTGGNWGPCEGAVGPVDERCDGVDDDCDGAVDEGLSRGCGSDVGACARGVEVCAAGAWGACEGAMGPVDERCDGVDSDCDGQVDEGLVEACGTDVGECVAGVRRCVDGAFGACDAVEPGDEACDGALDEDCDGSIDEACGCVDGTLVTCGSDIGRCAVGQQSCAGGMLGMCLGAVEPRNERCDGVDDDCDGAVDEGLGLGDACAVGEGICRREGVIVCDADAPRCGAQPGGPGLETCDQRDEDCDGRVDEELPVFSVAERRVAQPTLGYAPGAGPAAAQYAGLTGVAWTVSPSGADIGQGDRLRFELIDGQGRVVGQTLQLAGGLHEVRAVAVTSYTLGGDGGFVVFVGHRVRGVVEADLPQVTMHVVIVERGEVAETAALVLETAAEITEITGISAAANAEGIALAFAGPDRRGLPLLSQGFISFANEPPTFREGAAIEGGDQPALTWTGDQFVMAHRFSLAMQRGASIRLVPVGVRLVDPIVVDEGLTVAQPTVIGHDRGVLVAWSAATPGGVGVWLSAFELRNYTQTMPVLLSGLGAQARAPSLAADDSGVGVAWVDAREGDDATEVWFTRAWQPQRTWTPTGRMQLSHAAGRSEPVTLLGGAGMTAVWVDRRPIGPGLYLSAGAFGCPGADAPRAGEAVE